MNGSYEGYIYVGGLDSHVYGRMMPYNYHGSCRVCRILSVLVL